MLFILYMENPEQSTEKLPDLINDFGKVVGYKTNMQQLVAFFYKNNELSEREIKITIPFTIEIRTAKMLPRNKFNQGGKRLVLGKL